MVAIQGLKHFIGGKNIRVITLISNPGLKGWCWIDPRTWIVIQLIVLFLISDNVSADDSISEKSKSDYKWFVSIYGGLNVEENLAKIVVPNASISGSNYIVVGALAREIYRYKQWFSFELEGLVGKHFGPKDDQWEFAGLILGRWHTFPWDEYIDTSFAMGAGLSENSEISSIELQRDETPNAC